jgi:hypothetical protein
MDKIIVNEIFPRIERFQIELPNKHNVVQVHLALDENGFQKYDVFGIDGNLLIDNLELPPFIDDEENDLYSKYEWFIPYFEAISHYIVSNGLGLFS